MSFSSGDNNASCVVGPFIRLFDDQFTLDDVINADILLEISGRDGYEVSGINHINQISRHPLDLVQQLINPNHQYPAWAGRSAPPS